MASKRPGADGCGPPPRQHYGSVRRSGLGLRFGLIPARSVRNRCAVKNGDHVAPPDENMGLAERDATCDLRPAWQRLQPETASEALHKRMICIITIATLLHCDGMSLPSCFLFQHPIKSNRFNPFGNSYVSSPVDRPPYPSQCSSVAKLNR